MAIIQPPHYNSVPAKRWSGDPVWPNVGVLPNATPPPFTWFDGAPPPKKLPPPIPIRRRSIAVPVLNVFHEAPTPRKWMDYGWAEPITHLLPFVTVPPPFVRFDDVPAPKKLPPHIPTNRVSQALPASTNISVLVWAPPPKKLPPHIPVRRNTPTVVIAPSVLAQGLVEIDAFAPKKKPVEAFIFPNVATQPVVVVAAPASIGKPFLYESRLSVRWAGDNYAPNVTAQPLLIGIAQQVTDFEPQGRVPMRWPDQHAFPNVAIQPVGTTPPTVSYHYPLLPLKQPWPEDAAPPDVASLPTNAIIVQSSETIPGWHRIAWPEEAAPANIWALPVATNPITTYEYPAPKAKQWPGDDWLPPAVIEQVPVLPPQGAFFEWQEWPKPAFIRLDSWTPGFPLQPSLVPIYIPVIGYEIFIAYRTFGIAIPVRTYAITIPYRTFQISLSPLISVQTVQTFDVKEPTESWPLSFNMAPDLFSGETLAGVPAVTVTLYQGADSNPSNILNGTPGFDPTNTQVVVPVTGGLNGCQYRITVTCATTNPQKVLTLKGVLPVVSA